MPEDLFPPRPVLAIDTSSAQGALALYDGRSLSSRSWAAERSHTTTVLAEIHHLLSTAELEPRDLGAIGITIGPGAFTGLRVGFGVAKGLHLATTAPLIGISTLEVTALPHKSCGLPIIATIGAGRGRLVWAHFARTNGGVTETRAARNGTVDELAAEVASSGAVIVAGELDDDQAEVLASVPLAILPPRALRNRQPAAMAELAWRRWRAGLVDDPERLEPLYLSR